MFVGTFASLWPLRTCGKEVGISLWGGDHRETASQMDRCGAEGHAEEHTCVQEETRN